ncbi:MAG: hypothetical protein ABR553_09090 [Gammaproteobacteria bacterium]
MEKRLSCAAASLGLAIDVAIRKTPEAMKIAYDKTPAILVAGRLGLTGLRRTEEIETWLRERFPPTPSTKAAPA